MTKKVLAFDLDGTLVPSKSTIRPRMSSAVHELLGYYEVCIISGGKFTQFQKQFLANLPKAADKFVHLHLMPTCGTQYYAYEVATATWKRIYAEVLGEEEKNRIIRALTRGFHDLGYDTQETYGPPIDDRGGLITYSALGQDVVDALGDEGVKLKAAWDPDGEKKRRLREYIAALIPDFEVRIGSATSIDVTRPGVDKAYGMQKLIAMLGVTKDEIIYFGDRLYETGNDYPVKAMGIESVEVSSWEDTARMAEGILQDAKREVRL